MSILKNLDKVHAAVVVDKLKGSGPQGANKGALGDAVGKLAVKALTGGINSPDWKTYMSLFADNAAQLTLLTVPDPQNDPDYAPQARAYIVANAVCAADTNTFTRNKVNETFGAALSEVADGEPGKFRPADLNIPDVEFVPNP